MKNLITTIFILLLPLLFAVTCDATDTPHYGVVAEYIRSLSSMYEIQLTAGREYKEDKNEENPARSKMLQEIRNSTRAKLELNRSIQTLREMRLSKPNETLIPITIALYKKKIKLHDELIEIAKAFTITFPEPGVDYDKLSQRMPEITADMNFIDRSIFESMELVFALLIDERPDTEGNMNHLSITKAQRQKLINDLDTAFSGSLDIEKKNWTVKSAALLKNYLANPAYKCSDEWD